MYLFLECLTCHQLTLVNQKLPLPLLVSSRILQVPNPYFLTAANAWCLPCQNFYCLGEDLGTWGPKSCFGTQFPFPIRISLRVKARGECAGTRAWILESGASFLGQTSQSKLGDIHPKQILHVCVGEDKLGAVWRVLLPITLCCSQFHLPVFLPDPPHLIFTQHLILSPPHCRLHSCHPQVLQLSPNL